LSGGQLKLEKIIFDVLLTGKTAGLYFFSFLRGDAQREDFALFWHHPGCQQMREYRVYRKTPARVGSCTMKVYAL